MPLLGAEADAYGQWPNGNRILHVWQMQEKPAIGARWLAGDLAKRLVRGVCQAERKEAVSGGPSARNMAHGLPAIRKNF
jgi:hypothetical protein